MLPPPAADDYYTLLGIEITADDHELRRAWRQLAARWHPDRAGHAATPTFQQLSAAYSILSNPTTRAAYDRRRRRITQLKTTTPPPTPSRPAPATMLKRLTGNLVSLLARGAAHLDEPGYITLILRQAEAATGGMAMVALPVEIRCPACATKPHATPCTRCRGTRIVEELFSAWLTIPPGVTAGQTLAPSVELPGTIDPVRFRVHLAHPKSTLS
jgi:molecular chaperone DnaJ/curved DNA-binding protein